MDIFKSKQLYIKKFDCPFDAVKQMMNNEEIINQILNYNDIKIKKFLGSNWLIKDSGFILYYSNIISIGFLLIDIIENDFIYYFKFRITHLNGKELKNENYSIVSLTKNTIDNYPIYENRIEYTSELALKEYENIVKFSISKKILEKIFSNCNSSKNKINNKINAMKNLIINHSCTIKKNYKDVFNFFYDFNNIVKCLKADKIWKVIQEENDKKYKDTYIIINENNKVLYHVISIDEIKGEKIEIIFDKSNKSFQLLNSTIKFHFFNIEKNLCFFLYETFVPINIPASNYHKISYYAYYCIKTAKKYIEKNK